MSGIKSFQYSDAVTEEPARTDAPREVQIVLCDVDQTLIKEHLFKIQAALESELKKREGIGEERAKQDAQKIMNWLLRYSLDSTSRSNVPAEVMMLFQDNGEIIREALESQGINAETQYRDGKIINVKLTKGIHRTPGIGAEVFKGLTDGSKRIALTTQSTFNETVQLLAELIIQSQYQEESERGQAGQNCVIVYGTERGGKSKFGHYDHGIERLRRGAEVVYVAILDDESPRYQNDLDIFNARPPQVANGCVYPAEIFEVDPNREDQGTALSEYLANNAPKLGAGAGRGAAASSGVGERTQYGRFADQAAAAGTGDARRGGGLSRVGRALRNIFGGKKSTPKGQEAVTQVSGQAAAAVAGDVAEGSLPTAEKLKEDIINYTKFPLRFSFDKYPAKHREAIQAFVKKVSATLTNHLGEEIFHIAKAHQEKVQRYISEVQNPELKTLFTDTAISIGVVSMGGEVSVFDPSPSSGAADPKATPAGGRGQGGHSHS